jgi:N utilization substance protein A
MNKDLIAVFEYLERERGIKREIVISAIEDSLCAAARKSIAGAANVTVSIHPKTADIEVYCEKEIVETVEVPSLEISLQEAQEIDPECEIGQFIDVLTTPEGFGRIAAQKARQIIAQKLRHAEKDVIHEEYRHRIHEILTGVVKRFVRGSNIIVDLGKVEAIMPMRHYPKTERYQVGDRVTALLLDVVETENGGAEVLLSRSHPEFVKQLLIQEVPEIAEGIVTVESIVREPGYRTKFTVRTNDPRIDPVGACVGTRGVRIKNIGRKLNNEKIDVVPYATDVVELLQNALAPVEIKKIRVSDEEVSIVVSDEDYPTALGKKGQNARLLSKLIDTPLEISRLSDYNRQMEMEQRALAFADDPLLKQPLAGIKGVSAIMFQHFVAMGFETPEDFLKPSMDEFMKRSGVSKDVAEDVLEKLRAQLSDQEAEEEAESESDQTEEESEEV